MHQTFRILVLGGYGVFGTQIVEALSQESNLHILIAGRTLSKAQALVDSLSDVSLTKLEALTIDAQSENLTEKLSTLNVNLVIHTCGPFQGQEYFVAKACIANGINYLDLADGRDFVCNIEQLDEDAKNSNCLVISGASSVPGLSSAVINKYKNQFSHLKSIECYILPGNKSEHGEATVSSVLSYTGKPIRVWQNKQWTHVFGWQNIQRIHLQGLGYRWAANCDVPDLELFPKHYPEVENVKFQAGSELSFMHLSLWVLSGLSRLKLIRNWNVFAKAFTRMTHWFLPFGTDTGGMTINLNGLDRNSQPLAINWQLIATDGDGPKVPALPAIILAKKIIKNQLKLIGAMPCLELFSVDDFQLESNDLSITLTTSNS